MKLYDGIPGRDDDYNKWIAQQAPGVTVDTAEGHKDLNG